MNQETNRVAQIIATAADKHLGVRPDGQPKPQDKAAAKAVVAEYLLIRRSELPATGYATHSAEWGAEWFVDVASRPESAWLPVSSSADITRRTGLEYLAAAEAIESWNDREQARKRGPDTRRDELAKEFSPAGMIPFCELPYSSQKAIDRIIDMEGLAT